MPSFRFNHMELTLPEGGLSDETREEIKRFYGEVFGMEALDVPILGQIGLLLRTDPETSQFILLTESRKPMASPGFDHLGFLFDTRAEVDEKLEQIQKWQAEDARVQLKEYEDLEAGDTVTHAFYVKFLLPIWFDVQCIEGLVGSGPSWKYA